MVKIKKAIRQTSIDCYYQIKKEGLLSKRRFQVYELMCQIAPCTASELQNSMDYYDGGRDCMKRISELFKLGVVFERGQKLCSITGRTVIWWDLTDNLPSKIVLWNDNKKPKNLNKCIEYVNREMHRKGLIFADVTFLNSIK